MPNKSSITKAAFIVFLGSICFTAHAIADTQRIEIPAGDLTVALESLAQQTNVDLVYQDAQVKGLRTRGVSGNLTPQEAVLKLLEGTQLKIRTDEATGAILIKPAEQTSQREMITLEEVVVTAQKREERLQDVPVSVSVVTGEEIKAKGVTRLRDLQYSIPGLSIFSTQGPGQDVIQIGGVSNVNGLATVGVYLDEMAVNGGKVQGGASGSNIDVRLLDMARVEVLRGPQGTLYGEGSMGGTIRYITNSPDLTAYAGSFEVEGGQIEDGGESYKANGVVNVPLVEEKLGLRLLAAHERNGGWIDNTTSGQSDINEADLTTFRAKLLARPTPELELSLLYLHQKIDQDYSPFGVDGQHSLPVQTEVHDRYDLINALATYDLGALRILNSVGYLDRPLDFQLDFTPVFLPLLEAPPPFGFGLPSGFITQIPFAFRSTQRVLTDELRFSSANPSALNWTVGAYYRRARTETDQATSTSPGQLPIALFQSNSSSESEAFAIFGDVSYGVTEHLTAAVGARYYRDKQRAGVTNGITFGFPTVLDAREATFDSFNPRFNLSYTFSPTSMIYFNAAKGFRSGGFNGIVVPGVPLTYAPDELWHYEVGSKQQLFDRRLELAADIYYTDWKDVQTTVLIQPGNLAVTENTGKVDGWGADLSVTVRPLNGLSLMGTLGWNDLAYASGTTSALHDPGDPVDEAVRLSYSVSLEYRRMLFGSTTGFFRADYQHAGPSELTVRSQNLFAEIPEHDRTNVRAGLDFGSYEISVFATNLSDDRTVLFPAIPGSPYNIEQTPRTVGIALRADF